LLSTQIYFVPQLQIIVHLPSDTRPWNDNLEKTNRVILDSQSKISVAKIVEVIPPQIMGATSSTSKQVSAPETQLQVFSEGIFPCARRHRQDLSFIAANFATTPHQHGIVEPTELTRIRLD
jgi:hypothetical protein